MCLKILLTQRTCLSDQIQEMKVSLDLKEKSRSFVGSYRQKTESFLSDLTGMTRGSPKLKNNYFIFLFLIKRCLSVGEPEWYTFSLFFGSNIRVRCKVPPVTGFISSDCGTYGKKNFIITFDNKNCVLFVFIVIYYYYNGAKNLSFYNFFFSNNIQTQVKKKNKKKISPKTGKTQN